jgi:hypothetical protein
MKSSRKLTIGNQPTEVKEKLCAVHLLTLSQIGRESRGPERKWRKALSPFFSNANDEVPLISNDNLLEFIASQS